MSLDPLKMQSITVALKKQFDSSLHDNTTLILHYIVIVHMYV